MKTTFLRGLALSAGLGLGIVAVTDCTEERPPHTEVAKLKPEEKEPNLVDAGILTDAKAAPDGGKPVTPVPAEPKVLKNMAEIKAACSHILANSSLYFGTQIDCLIESFAVKNGKRIPKAIAAEQASFPCEKIIDGKMLPEFQELVDKGVVQKGKKGETRIEATCKTPPAAPSGYECITPPTESQTRALGKKLMTPAEVTAECRTMLDNPALYGGKNELSCVLTIAPEGHAFEPEHELSFQAPCSKIVIDPRTIEKLDKMTRNFGGGHSGQLDCFAPPQVCRPRS